MARSIEREEPMVPTSIATFTQIINSTPDHKIFDGFPAEALYRFYKTVYRNRNPRFTNMKLPKDMGSIAKIRMCIENFIAYCEAQQDVIAQSFGDLIHRARKGGEEIHFETIDKYLKNFKVPKNRRAEICNHHMGHRLDKRCILREFFVGIQGRVPSEIREYITVAPVVEAPPVTVPIREAPAIAPVMPEPIIVPPIVEAPVTEPILEAPAIAPATEPIIVPPVADEETDDELPEWMYIETEEDADETFAEYLDNFADIPRVPETKTLREEKARELMRMFARLKEFIVDFKMQSLLHGRMRLCCQVFGEYVTEWDEADRQLWEQAKYKDEPDIPKPVVKSSDDAALAAFWANRGM